MDFDGQEATGVYRMQVEDGLFSSGVYFHAVEPLGIRLIAEVKALRAAGKPTLPTTVAVELATNPFIRVDSAEIRANLGMANASDAEVFAEVRTRKNNF